LYVEPSKPLTDFATSKASDGFSRKEHDVIVESHDLLEAQLMGENIQDLIIDKVLHKREEEFKLEDMLDSELDGAKTVKNVTKEEKKLVVENDGKHNKEVF
jgi:excinuclease UvrABC ATPase subunit